VSRGAASPLARRLRALRDPVVTSKRLLLLLPSTERLTELVRLLQEPSVARWTLNIPYPYRTADGRSWLRRVPAHRRAGSDLTLQIVRRSDRRLVGGIGLHKIDAAHRRAELGYWVGRPFRRQGFATEAARALCGFAFRRLGLHRLEARLFPGNAGSVTVLRRAGFRREGRLRKSVAKPDGFRDEVVYGRLAGSAASPPRVGGRRRDEPSGSTR
jgi:[ribosomal protein S5]-alanine N-acetyltransferase